ncbi:MAG: molecular chaperone TorD family protein [Betaproteobacteria bacterium]|nr:molecular chaperone TorD family protein [Betaproteobacteria bacterium]
MNPNVETVRTQAVTKAEAIAPEDRARADMYALIASLFYGAPDANLLRAIVQAPSAEGEAEDASLAQAWRELQRAAAVADPDAVRDEYERLFVAVGKAPVTLYMSHYLRNVDGSQALVAIRDELARLGFSRRAGAGEPEDHISALCDVMRMLIAGAESGLGAQQDFFARFVRPAYQLLMADIAGAQGADFYRIVGRLAQAFFDVETQSFEIELE